MKVSYKYHTFRVPLCLLRWLKNHMRYVRAAGGIVEDADGMRLLILRNGRWDLPKGKVEADETLLQAALRETQEETGILPTTHYPLPTKTYHLFNLYGGWHLKQTSWFRMHTDQHQPTGTPQQEEGITECCWVTPDEWHRRLHSSYGTLRTLERQID